jgi:hypothetical protein
VGAAVSGETGVVAFMMPRLSVRAVPTRSIFEKRTFDIGLILFLSLLVLLFE